MDTDEKRIPECGEPPVWMGLDEDGRDIILEACPRGLFLRVCRPEDAHLLPPGVQPPRTLEEAKELIEQGRRRREHMASLAVEAEGVAVSSHVMAQPDFPSNEILVLDVAPRQLQGNRFRLWLPETVRTNEWSTAQNIEMRWEATNAGRTLKGAALAGPPIRLDIEIDINADHLDLRLLLHNNSPTVQQDIEVNICLQLAQAPDFRDQDGNRMFVWTGDRLDCIRNVAGPPETNLRFHKEKSCFVSVEDSNRGFGCIGVESRSGTPLAMAWQSHSGYCSNTAISMCCLHANPIVDRLEPGQAKTIRGWLGWRGEDVASLCRRARDMLAVH